MNYKRIISSREVRMFILNFSQFVPDQWMVHLQYKMIDIAESLSVHFPHVRVDLYEVNKQIIFGELTFFNANGYMKFEPDELDHEVGNAFILPEVTDKVIHLGSTHDSDWRSAA